MTCWSTRVACVAGADYQWRGNGGQSTNAAAPLNIANGDETLLTSKRLLAERTDKRGARAAAVVRVPDPASTPEFNPLGEALYAYHLAYAFGHVGAPAAAPGRRKKKKPAVDATANDAVDAKRVAARNELRAFGVAARVLGLDEAGHAYQRWPLLGPVLWIMVGGVGTSRVSGVLPERY
ncbi:hypothetical protein ACLQ24_29745, partial [Micromonospora sp. DT4]|uniref:hypothetical protein n=1 Tax=Micromonospora sp. DT4 TaxID=3393438 RepID=UPI003CF6DE20